MPEKEPTSNFLEGFLSVIDHYTRCYRSKEGGEFITKVYIDRGRKTYSVKGGPTDRGREPQKEEDSG